MSIRVSGSVAVWVPIVLLFLLAGGCGKGGGPTAGFDSVCEKVSAENHLRFYPNRSYFEGDEGVRRGQFICAASSTARGPSKVREAIVAFESLEQCCRTIPIERLEAGWLYAHELEDLERARSLLCSVDDPVYSEPATDRSASQNSTATCLSNAAELDASVIKDKIEIALEALYLQLMDVDGTP